MKRSNISLHDIASMQTLAYAFWRAAYGKYHKKSVQQFAGNLEQELNQLAVEILHESVPVGHYHTFQIHDPKLREICAPCFKERVLHHALIAHIGPVLEKYAIDDSYACRRGKGSHRAVNRVQHHLRFPWYTQIDIKRYFDSIDHAILKKLLAKRFKYSGLVLLLFRIIDSYEKTPGKGLPIGALTSQYFANHYLDGLDRFVLEICKAKGYVRYMDDAVWFCNSKAEAKEIYYAVKRFLKNERALEIKENWRLQRSRAGITFCGYRIVPNAIRLTRRKKCRYTKKMLYWQSAFSNNEIDEQHLQYSYDAIRTIIAHSDSLEWRRNLAASAVVHE